MRVKIFLPQANTSNGGTGDARVNKFFNQLSTTGSICAHRGARSIAPENTCLAMEQARRCGADLWETDVQMTADGELILFHDATLERTTDAADHPEFTNRSLNVNEFTAAELETLDAGSWFLATDPFKTVAAGDVAEKLYSEIKGQKIPRLDDVLEYCRNYNFLMNLEIKDQNGTAADDQIVRKILDSLKESQTEDLVLISSFNHNYLRQVKQLNPTIALAALVEEHHPENLLSYLHNLDVDAYHPDQLITDTALVQQLVAAGMRVNLWTVNDSDQAKDYFAAGATFICTDWPQRLVEAGHS